MGLRPWELERFTLSEYFNAMHGLAKANAEAWGQARLIAYWALVPHTKKGKNLKLTDIMVIPLIDGADTGGKSVGKAYRLTPEEIEQWHADTWVPSDEREEHDHSTTT